MSRNSTHSVALRPPALALLPGPVMLHQAVEFADRQGAAVDRISLRWRPRDGYQAVTADLKKCQVLDVWVHPRGRTGPAGVLGWREPGRTLTEWEATCRMLGGQVPLPDDGGLWQAYAAWREAAAQIQEAAAAMEEAMAPELPLFATWEGLWRCRAAARRVDAATFRRQAAAARRLAAEPTDQELKETA